MPDNGDSIAARYACHCLNVRFQSLPTQTSPPDENRDPAFIPVFVGDDGIKIHHIQTTVRSKSRGIPIPGTNRCLQYTNLRCLLCDTLTYQICNILSIEMESAEGPLLPSDDWAETEIMKSANGWIDIHKDCLTGNAILLVEASPSFSRTFSISLPSMTTSPTPPASVIALSSAILGSPSAVPTSPSPVEKSYLSNMKPLYLPPPYSQSHPTFVHLASVATQQSNALRMAGEQYISDIVNKKIAEIEAIEADLKRQTEKLWKKYREVADRLTSEKQGPGSSTRPGALDQTTDSRGTISSPVYGTPVTVRDFTPIRVVVQRSPPPSISRPSMLSASLASSSHFPNDRLPQTTSVPDSPSSISSRTESSTLVPPTATGDAQSINVLQFRRNIDDSINTATSYRYFINLEEDMERHRKERDAFRKKWAPEESQLDGLALIGSTNGNKKPKKKTLVSLSAVSESKEEQNVSAEPREAHLKGKRKVTFDAKPAVVTIKREVQAENEDEEAEAAQDPREMIFNLDDMDGINTAPGPEPSLPLLEQPTVFRPVRKARAIDTAGLPGSLSALRGASLPFIPHMRSRSQHGVDTSFGLISIQRPSPPEENHSSNSSNSPIAVHDQQDGDDDDGEESGEDEEPFDPRDEMILDLVAAGTPSHRGAWKADSKAWLTFTQRQGRKEKAQARIPEEVGEGKEVIGITDVSRLNSWYDGEESDDEREEDRQARLGIPGSMPINIVNRIKPRETLGLASYKPKSALEAAKEHEEGRPEFKNMSSAAIRKLQYAERDQDRAIDPGALDFTVDDDNDEPEEEDPAKTEPGSRGRKHALKILQKRNEVPAEGMWRSLAE